jgi:hypothetical protein
MAPGLLLSGCLFTTRKLPVPKAPTVTRDATADELVASLNERWSKLGSLYANVEIQASVMKTKEGTARDFTTFPAIILMRKPEMLRVVGRLPVLGTRMFDMVSDGKNFTLYVPSKELAYKGLNKLRRKSENAIENMRPGFFLDALMVRGLGAEDEFMVTADTLTVEDPKKKKLLLVPEYILSVMGRKQGSRELRPMRVIHFHREDLLPYQQDLYDEQGNLEQQVFYGRYAEYGVNLFPSTVTIKRPLEEYQIVLTVDRVQQNRELTDDQFQVQLGEETKVQKLE